MGECNNILNTYTIRVQRIHSSARIYEYKMGKDGRTSDNKSHFILLYYRHGFRPICRYWSYKIPSRDPKVNDMEPRFTLANHGIDNYWSGKMKSGNSDGSAI